MSEEHAVAVREESPQSLLDELERRKSEARSLELQVTRKEAELRNAQEEQALLKELRTVNEMIVHKKERQQSTADGSQKSGPRGVKISPESLQELIALEDELKLENKKTTELQNQASVTSHQIEDVEKALEEKAAQLAIVKRSTGYDVDARTATSGSAALNEYLERKKIVARLCEEQQTLKGTSDRLTKEVESLAEAVKEGEELEEKIREAEEQLVVERQALAEATEQVKSCERLHKKKERVLDETKPVDEYKAIRILESDKRVLHGNLLKLRETSESNSKSILSLEVRLRQLETRLEAVNLFLTQVFAEVEDDDAIEGVPEDATDVPLAQFEALSRELALSRETVAQRDDQLLSHDAQVEQLERKIGVLQAAISSRTVSSQLHCREKERQAETLVSDMKYLRGDFENEHRRLVNENAELRKKLAQL